MGPGFRRCGGSAATGSAPANRGNRGGRIAAGSIAAMIAGAVIKDLNRSDSLIRKLVAYGRKRLTERREPANTINITDSVDVEVVNLDGPDSDESNHHDDQEV